MRAAVLVVQTHEIRALPILSTQFYQLQEVESCLLIQPFVLRSIAEDNKASENKHHHVHPSLAHITSHLYGTVASTTFNRYYASVKI